MIGKSLPAWKIAIKLLNELLVPLLWVPAVLFTILPCFKPAEGSNSRVVHSLIAIACYVVIITVKVIHGRLKKEGKYTAYQSRIVSKLDLANLVPLFVLAVVIAFPFYLLFVTSIKSPIEANSFDFTWWPKQGATTQAYNEIVVVESVIGITMTQAVINSFVYAIIPNVIGLLASAVAAYSFSKLRYRGRDAMYYMLIMTMMMPGCVTMATGYLMFDWYGWTNSPLPLIVPGLFGGAACIMFLREFFMGIPDGLLEAASIDGAGRWRRFFSIVMPLAKPALMAQFILGFISSFNDYMGPLIYLNNPSGYTVQVTLDFLSSAVMDNSLVAAAGVLALVPMLLLYIIFQKTILKGISISSGLKG